MFEIFIVSGILTVAGINTFLMISLKYKSLNGQRGL